MDKKKVPIIASALGIHTNQQLTMPVLRTGIGTSKENTTSYTSHISIVSHHV